MKNTLVIDDVRTFRQEDFPDRAFTYARNSQDGRALLETGAFESLFLDYDLSQGNANPDDNGWWIAKWLRLHAREIPALTEVLIITTLQDKAQKMLAPITAAIGVKIDVQISDIGAIWNHQHGR